MDTEKKLSDANHKM